MEVVDPGAAGVELVAVIVDPAATGVDSGVAVDPDNVADGEMAGETHSSFGRSGVVLGFVVSCWAISELVSSLPSFFEHESLNIFGIPPIVENVECCNSDVLFSENLQQKYWRKTFLNLVAAML